MNIEIKKGTGNFAMPVFGLGTWMMGGDSARNPGNDDERDIAAVRNALNSGITHIDTAEMYAAGYAEKLVGRAIKGFDRSKLFIASKVWDTNLRYDDVLVSAENSLKRLDTGYMDLYLIHKPNPDIELGETVRAIDRLIDEGTVKSFGVSNFSVERTRQAGALAEHPVANVQVHYNLIYREPELSGLLEYCVDNRIILTAWRPVQKGAISSGETPVLDQVCAKYNCTAAQAAVSWLVSQENVVTISTMRSPEHLSENLGALRFRMDAGDIELLRRDFPGRQPVSDVVPLM